MELNSQQQEAVDYEGGHLLIVAGPGTGKTHTITQKIFHLLQNGTAPENIVAMTFTRKAGEQLTHRLRKLLKDAEKLPFAGTFHSFCLQILREHFKSEIKIISQKEQKEILKSVGDDQNLYQKKLTELNVLDFDGILVKTLELIKNNTQLKQNLHQKILYLFVDEYQDVNETQYQLIKELTGPNTKLCAIGDPDQAIYSFRGANLEHFLHFEKDFPGTKILNLERNYRSTPNIVECANALIEHNTQRVHKNLLSSKEPGPQLSVIPAATPLSEAIWIAKEVVKLVGGTTMQEMDQKTGHEYETHYHFTDIAVIYRTNHQGKLLETALKKEGLPYQRIAATSWFNEKEIEAVIQHLTATLNAQNLAQIAPVQNIKNILGTSQAEKPHDNMLRLLNFATQFDDLKGQEGLQTMIDELKLLQDQDAYDPRMEAVTLMSIHAAKGLEFPVVFIAGVEEGKLPYVSKERQTDIEEERRLMYVGITRAKERLFLSHAKSNAEKPLEPSTFLEEISKHLIVIQPEKRNNKALWKKKQLSIF